MKLYPSRIEKRFKPPQFRASSEPPNLSLSLHALKSQTAGPIARLLSASIRPVVWAGPGTLWQEVLRISTDRTQSWSTNCIGASSVSRIWDRWLRSTAYGLELWVSRAAFAHLPNRHTFTRR